MENQQGFGMGALQPIEQNGMRVLTTAQLAESYGTDTDRVNRNFNNNKDRYKEGKHFFLLEGDALKEFKMTTGKNDGSSIRINKLYLWTEKGAWLHAKSLNTDQAWDAYEMLVDEYYKMKEQTEMTTEELTSMLTLRLSADVGELVQKVETVETRLDDFEFNSPILPQQAKALNDLVAEKVRSISSAIYNNNQDATSKLFKRIGSDIKRAFNVNSRPMIAKKDYEKAIDFIQSWQPDSVTKHQLELNFSGPNPELH